MSTALSVSVVIPSLNSPLIDGVVNAVARQTYPAAEIIVVGRDEAGLLGAHDRCVFIDTHHPLGPAAARNLGAEHALGDILCFLDADCFAAPNWLDLLVRHHLAGEEVVGGGVRFDEHSYWTIVDNVATFADFLACTRPGVRPHLPSLNMSLRRSLFMQSGGFDERFPRPAGEDTELSFRLRRAGHRLVFAPGAVVTHRPARSTARAVWQHLRQFGATYGAVQQQHVDLLGPSLRVRLSRRRPYLLAALAPLLAALDTALTYRRHACLMRYWYAVPGVIAARIAWYSGLIFGYDGALEGRGS